MGTVLQTTRKIKVPLRPDTLQWAMKRSRLEVDDLARTLRVKPEKVQAWCERTEQPSYAQAKNLAKKLRIPFSQLLIPPPKQIDLPVPDFRRGLVHGQDPSPELLEAIYDALRKRDWYRAYRRDAVCPFVGSVSPSDHPTDIATAIRQWIPVQDLQQETSNWQQFLNRMVESIETAGILVLRQGYVETNTRRRYDPTEFSGFAIADRVAPIIFLNNGDFIARLVFTLAHELAHIWLGQDALDAELERFEPSHMLERLCDAVAADLLMPEEVFVEAWHGEPVETAQKQARRFKVSAWATLRRARNLNLIREEEYRKAFRHLQHETKKKKGGGGGNFWTNVAIRNSPTFTRTVMKAALRGEISLKEVASLLNLRLGTALSYLERMENVPP